METGEFVQYRCTHTDGENRTVIITWTRWVDNNDVTLMDNCCHTNYFGYMARHIEGQAERIQVRAPLVSLVYNFRKHVVGIVGKLKEQHPADR